MSRPSKKKEGDNETKLEQRIVLLVKNVRETDCEKSFIEIREYLDSYVKIFVRKYKIPGCDYDEIEQECLCALRYKAIEDFNAKRGKFKSFAVLCIKRHLFSLIKGSNQQKRLALNQSVSLDEERSDDESLSLASLVIEDGPSADEKFANQEIASIEQSKFMEQLSDLEKEVFKLYRQKFKYEEIVVELKKIFPKMKNKSSKSNKKLVDNARSRLLVKWLQFDSKRDF